MSVATGVGIISGINWENMIQQISTANSKPITIMQKKIAIDNSKTQAFDSLSIDLSSLRNQMNNLSKNLSKSTDEEKIAQVNLEVNALKNNFNKLTSNLSGLTSYNAKTKSASILFADSTARSIKYKLSKSIESLSSIGLSIQTDGSLKLDSAKLESAIKNDLSGTISVLSKAAESIDKSLLPFVSEIDVRKQNIAKSISDSNEQIDKLQSRIDVRAEQMRKKFRSLESILAKYQGIGDYVTNSLNRVNNVQ